MFNASQTSYPYLLTKTLANLLSNSFWSGMGCDALLLTLACRKWWFGCLLFQWLMTLVGDGVIIDITSSTGCTSLEVVNPILILFYTKFLHTNKLANTITQTICGFLINASTNIHNLMNKDRNSPIPFC